MLRNTTFRNHRFATLLLLAGTVLLNTVLLAGAGTASAKEWAQKMFKATHHEFGHVAQGAKTEYLFEIQNPYEEDVHIADIRSSCGCTTPTITKSTLKTWEKGAVVATFNTKTFIGQRSATVTVVFDKPFYAEVQLTVGGYIHSDVDFQPGSVSFGNVDQGAGATQQLAVTYRGRNAWQITDVRSANRHLEVDLSDAVRTANSVTYRMNVTLKPEAPAGTLMETLNIVTNDPRLPNVSLSVEGKVVPPLSVSPASLFVGVLRPGQTATKQMVISGKQPFKILSIRCDDPAFQFKTSEVTKKVHLVPVTFTAGSTPGEIQQTIEIETDLPAAGQTTCLARGTIQAGPSEKKPTETASAAGQIR